MHINIIINKNFKDISVQIFSIFDDFSIIENRAWSRSFLGENGQIFLGVG